MTVVEPVVFGRVMMMAVAVAISGFSNPVRMNHAYNLLNLHG